MELRQLTLSVNGRTHELWVGNNRTLLDALHDDIGMPDVRYGCGEGVCGTCTVLLDGEPTSACLLFAVQAEGHEVTTAAGMLGPDEALHPLQQCFLRRGAAQCGFCTPGMLLTSQALVERERRPSREEIRYELVGNLCRCTGYTKILDAVEEYADARASHDEQGLHTSPTPCEVPVDHVNVIDGGLAGGNASSGTAGGAAGGSAPGGEVAR